MAVSGSNGKLVFLVNDKNEENSFLFKKFLKVNLLDCFFQSVLQEEPVLKDFVNFIPVINSAYNLNIKSISMQIREPTL